MGVCFHESWSTRAAWDLMSRCLGKVWCMCASYLPHVLVEEKNVDDGIP